MSYFGRYLVISLFVAPHINLVYFINKNYLIRYTLMKYDFKANKHSFQVIDFNNKHQTSFDNDKKSSIKKSININDIKVNIYEVIPKEKRLISSEENIRESIPVIEQIFIKKIDLGLGEMTNKEIVVIGNISHLLHKYLPNEECAKLLRSIYSPMTINPEFNIVLEKLSLDNNKKTIRQKINSIKEMTLDRNDIILMLEIEDLYFEKRVKEYLQ